MSTKRVTKLLAVVALSTSPAAADPAPRPRVDPWATTAFVRTEVPARPREIRPVTLSLTALVELIVQPRTMPSGAPACGNVASRAPQPVDCERRRP